MATKAQLLVAVLTVSAFVAARPTWADTAYQPPAIVARADNMLASALPALMDSGLMESRSLPALGSARHSLTIGELQYAFTPRLSARAGLGLAAVVDVPRDATSDLPHTGCAMLGAVNYTLAHLHGFRIAAEASAVHVS